MNKKLIPLLISATFITACDQQQTTATNSMPTTTVSKENAVAIVNGTYISKASLSALEEEVALRSRGRKLPKDKLLEELIQREILQQEAINKKLDESADFLERLDTIKKSLLAQAAVQDYLKSSPLTDAEIEAEYNKNVAKSGTEYQARHILVKTEEEAKQIIEELKKGADFIELAKTKSTGPSGPKGGDLGWFAAGQMVPPFSEATIALEDGKFTTEPVKTQFGWHIILREGSRKQTPPPFESVKEQIRPMLQRKKTQDFLNNLRNQATVETFLPAEQEQIVAPKAKAPAEESEIKETADSINKKVAEPEKEVKKEAAGEPVQTKEAISGAVDKAGTTVTEVKKDVTDKATQIKETISDTTKNVTKKVLDKVESSTKDATEIVTKTIEKANESVKESTSGATTKALEAVTQ